MITSGAPGVVMPPPGAIPPGAYATAPPGAPGYMGAPQPGYPGAGYGGMW